MDRKYQEADRLGKGFTHQLQCTKLLGQDVEEVFDPVGIMAAPFLRLENLVVIMMLS